MRKYCKVDKITGFNNKVDLYFHLINYGVVFFYECHFILIINFFVFPYCFFIPNHTYIHNANINTYDVIVVIINKSMLIQVLCKFQSLSILLMILKIFGNYEGRNLSRRSVSKL